MLFGYIEEPKTIDDFKKLSYNSTEPGLQSVLIEGNYSTFTLSFEKLNGAKYLVFAVAFQKTLDYLSIYIGPKKKDEYDNNPNPKEKDINPKENENYSEQGSIQIWLIILIAVLYTVVLLVVFYFILRKCGYSKKGESSNEITKDFALQPDN